MSKKTAKPLSRKASEGSWDLFAKNSEEVDRQSLDSENSSQSSEGIPPNQEYARRREEEDARKKTKEEAQSHQPELVTQLGRAFSSQDFSATTSSKPETASFAQTDKTKPEKRKLPPEEKNAEEKSAKQKPQYDFPELGESPSSSPKNSQVDIFQQSYKANKAKECFY